MSNNIKQPVWVPSYIDCNKCLNKNKSCYNCYVFTGSVGYLNYSEKTTEDKVGYNMYKMGVPKYVDCNKCICKDMSCSTCFVYTGKSPYINFTRKIFGGGILNGFEEGTR